MILQHKRICPVEVKSSRYKTHSSLDKFREKFKGKIGQAYVLYTKDLKLEGDILYLPIYMASFCENLFMRVENPGDVLETTPIRCCFFTAPIILRIRFWLT